MAVNETYELAIVGTYHGQQIITTHHFREIAPVAGPPDPEQQLLDDWQTTLQTAWRNIVFTTYTLVTLKVQKVCGTAPLPIGVEEGVGLAGTRGIAGINELPAWMALVVNERTAVRGRSYRGRYFVPCVADEDITGDNFVTTAGQMYALVGTYNDGLMTRYGPSGTSANWRLVVHSRKLAAVIGTQCQQSSTLVTQLVRTLAPATMKSRKA